MRIVSAIELLKGRERPIGYVSAGGAIKTAKGWRMLSPEEKNKYRPGDVIGEKKPKTAEESKKPATDKTAAVEYLRKRYPDTYKEFYKPLTEGGASAMGMVTVSDMHPDKFVKLMEALDVDKLFQMSKKFPTLIGNFIDWCEEAFYINYFSDDVRANVVKLTLDIMIGLKNYARSGQLDSEIATRLYKQPLVTLYDENEKDESSIQKALISSWATSSKNAGALLFVDAAEVFLKEGDVKHLLYSQKKEKYEQAGVNVSNDREELFKKLLREYQQKNVLDKWSTIVDKANEFYGTKEKEIADDGGIWLYRGVQEKYDKKASNQLESWTPSEDLAKPFGSVLFKEYIRKEDVIACYITDAKLGSMGEREFIVLRRGGESEE